MFFLSHSLLCIVTLTVEGVLVDAVGQIHQQLLHTDILIGWRNMATRTPIG